MIRLFNDVLIDRVFDSVIRSISGQLNHLSSFKDIDIEETAERIAESLKIGLTELNKEKIHIEPKLGTRSGRTFPAGYDVNPNKDYPNAYVYYTIPFTGDSEIFKVKPNTFGHRKYNAEIGSNYVTFTLSANYATLDLPENKRDELKRTASEVIAFIEKNLDLINKEVTEFNATLKEMVTAEIKSRIDQENKMDDLKNDLKP
ncbi:hypothetical protein ES705_17205 [subsurface metagenome]